MPPRNRPTPSSKPDPAPIPEPSPIKPKSRKKTTLPVAAPALPPIPTDPSLSPFRRHVLRWAGGCGASICSGANRVYARGQLPCDVLFIGEAPGESENVVKAPFVGPAGQLLDKIVRDATFRLQLCPGCLELGERLVTYPTHHGGNTCNLGHNHQPDGRPLRLAFTNLVCCIPREPDSSRKATEPDDGSIISCKPRLQELVELADPAAIVCVGKLAWEWTEPGYTHSVVFHRDIPRLALVHPAAILRANLAQKGMMVQRETVKLSQFLEELGPQFGTEAVEPVD